MTVFGYEMIVWDVGEGLLDPARHIGRAITRPTLIREGGRGRGGDARGRGGDVGREGEGGGVNR